LSQLKRVRARMLRDPSYCARKLAHTSPTAADLRTINDGPLSTVERIRLPAIYPWRDCVEAGGLMAYGGDLGESLAAHGR
jgi:hypothetical protein